MKDLLYMLTLRASYTIEPEALLEFNELVPPGERSKVVQALMRRALVERTAQLDALAAEFETHPDFAQARHDAAAFGVTSADGLDEQP